PLACGHLLSAISTSVVRILREHYGRGPMKAKTYALDDIIVVVMRGSGFTPLEQTIMDSGQPERVVSMREDFQSVMAERYKRTIALRPLESMNSTPPMSRTTSFAPAAQASARVASNIGADPMSSSPFSTNRWRSRSTLVWSLRRPRLRPASEEGRSLMGISWT